MDLPPPPPAHVIIIQADDLGIDDLGYSGNALAYTPHLDRLARDSINALDFTVNPVCAPSRATLLSGRHFLRTGVSHVHGGKDYLHLDERIMPQVFKAGGWRTGMWGKWHLGRGDDYEPWKRGFDEAYCAKLYQHEQTYGQFNGTSVQHEGWGDDVMVDYAIDFLERSDGQPSLLYLPSMTPHGPLAAPAHWVEFHTNRGTPTNLAILNAMVSNLDANIGRLIETLEARNELSNTLLIFTSDNGPAINRGMLSDEERRLRKISARRGWKGDIWENGVRAPLLIHWPDHLEAGVVQDPLDQIDLLPTLLDWCGLTWPSDYPTLDGSSQKQLIEQANKGSQGEHDAPIFNYAGVGWITSKRAYDPAGILNEYNPVHPENKHQLEALEQPISVRQGRYKLLLNPYPPEDNKTPDWVLIDLFEDPGESTNVYDQLPDVAAPMQRLLLDWFEQIKAEPHAFTAPVFEVRSNRINEIPARMPYRIDGSLQNTVSTLNGWQAQRSASYQIRTDSTAHYNTRLTWRIAPPAGITFDIQAGEQRAVATTDGTLQTNFPTLKIPASSNDISLQQSTDPRFDGEPAELQLIQLIPTSDGL